MKKFLVLFFLIILVLAAYPFIFNNKTASRQVEGLPWQIKIASDGSSSVFGIKPGQTRFADVIRILGSDMKLAIVASKNEAGKLEMYYGHYRAGLISGKMVLQAKVGDAQLVQWKKGAVKVSYMPSGTARKYLLDSDSLPSILQSVVQSITFIPGVNLDEKIVVARFGQPVKRIVHFGVIHFLYPSKGLDVALYAKAKDVLQYVKPADFQQLEQPLQK